MPIDFYIKLTLAVYSVTELFPENEPLKYDIRNLANEILANLINNNYENTSRSIKELKGLFVLAEAQNWVDSRNFLVLGREYEEIEKLIQEKPISSGKPVEKSRTTRERKQRILEVLKEKKRIHLKELAQNFPQISKRTLIRDLEELYRSGVVVRVGNGRASCYNIKS